MGNVTDQTKIEVLIRQHDKCGICGESISDNPVEYHHMLPPRFGGDDSADNIVALCDREEHLYMHGGDFRNDVATSSDVFPYFNGGDPDSDIVELNSDDKVEATVDDKKLSNDDSGDDDTEAQLV